MRNNRRGLTLIEVLTATSIFSIALVAMLTTAVALFKATSYGGESLRALNLAREGIEVVRNKRDENFLIGLTEADNWRTGFDMSTAIIKPDVSTSSFLGKFALESVTYTIDDCVTTNKACQVFFDVASGLYGDAGLASVYGAVPTRFYRILEFTPIMCGVLTTAEAQGLCANGEEIGVKVTSQVQWYHARKLREAMLEITLFKWQ
jgi:prepilin-type N-terminal cleavage/methylation domain-containing protein